MLVASSISTDSAIDQDFLRAVMEWRVPRMGFIPDMLGLQGILTLMDKCNGPFIASGLWKACITCDIDSLEATFFESYHACQNIELLQGMMI